jgi:hypothetical protein
MRAILTGVLFAASIFLLSDLLSAGEVPDGILHLKSRFVSPGIGLSWGDGVLTYKGQDYPFTFQAKGLFRDVDAEITAAEMSGEVFNLPRVALFNGTYHKIDGEAAGDGGSRAAMKNLNGVVVNLISTVEGRKFVLGRDGMTVKLAEQKP